MTATNAEKVAAASCCACQNVQHGFVLLCVLRDCYFAHCCSLCHRLTYLDAPTAIACVAAVPFLGLQWPETATVIIRLSPMWTRL